MDEPIAVTAAPGTTVVALAIVQDNETVGFIYVNGAASPFELNSVPLGFDNAQFSAIACGNTCDRFARRLTSIDSE